MNKEKKEESNGGRVRKKKGTNYFDKITECDKNRHRQKDTSTTAKTQFCIANCADAM